MANILEAIYYWCHDVSQAHIGKWTSLTTKQVWKVTRACRLITAKFMLQNPELNRIGGVDKNGNPIKCQVDETHSGKNKYHRGNPTISTWVTVRDHRLSKMHIYFTAKPSGGEDRLMWA